MEPFGKYNQTQDSLNKDYWLHDSMHPQLNAQNPIMTHTKVFILVSLMHLPPSLWI